MQGGAKPPGPLAFEPIDPPKRQIVDSHRRRPSRHCGGGRSVTGEGGAYAHTSWALTTSSPTAVRAVAVLSPRSLQRPAHRCRARARQRAFHDKFAPLGEHLMHGLRYRILAGTALALILAVPMVGLAQGPNKMAPAPTTASPPAALSVEPTAA